MIAFLMLSCFFLYFSEAGAPFLTVSPGARAVGMGSAFTAIADDATASYYNPAGLAFQKEPAFTAMNSVFFPGLGQVIVEGLSSSNVPRGPEWLPGFWRDMRHLYLGGVLPITEGHCFGFGYTYISTGKFELRDENGTPIGEYESYDYALIMSYGARIHESLGVGISLKYVRSAIMPWLDYYFWRRYGGPFDRAYALDIGILWRINRSGFSLGASYQNFNSDSITYLTSGSKDILPILYRIGVCYDFCRFEDMLNSLGITRLILSHDWVSDLIGDRHEVWWCGGGEMVFQNLIALRAGYFNDEYGSRQGMTWGCGLKLGAMQVDCATDATIYDFPTENWRLQICLHPQEWNSAKPNPVLAGISSVLIPGGGQFYNGDALKGLILATMAYSLGEICYDDPLEEEWNANEVILSAIHIVSIVDAVFAAKSSRQEQHQ
jgi:hypothetical protein